MASRIGRPPRITTAQIAEAALAIGLDKATIRNVAEHLGMSVPGMYHHVRTREDLLALAAAHTLGELPLPDPAGRTLAAWLTEYGRFVYEALVAQPEVIGQILAGTTNTTRQAQHLEQFFAVCETHGVGGDEAFDLYWQLMAGVVGAAAQAVGRRAASAHPLLTDLGHAARSLGDAAPRVQALTAARRRDHDPFAVVELLAKTLAP